VVKVVKTGDKYSQKLIHTYPGKQKPNN